MLRIISVLLLLIISDITFASVSSQTYPATRSTTYVNYFSGNSGSSYTYSNPVDACTAYATQFYSTGTAGNGGMTYTYLSYSLNSYGQAQCLYNYKVWGVSQTGTKSYTAGYQQVYPYVCSAGDSLSGTTCTTQVDSCKSYSGQSGYFWVSKKAAPATVCSGTCLANISGTWGDAPDADPAAYTQHQYTYTGATGECTSDSGFADAATAAESNAAVAEKERLAKIQKAIDDAITACGGVGYYTSGTFNGETVIACTNQDKKTETTTTTTTSGATTTTANTSTTTNNNGQTTTVKPDGTSTTTGGTTTSSGKTSTSTTTTNPDGSTTTTTTASGATGTCSESDMKGTVGCADMGEIPDTADVPSDEEDFGLGSYTPWGSSSSACPAPPVVNGHIIDNSDQCSFFSKLKPFIIAAGFLIAVYISLGIRSSGGD